MVSQSRRAAGTLVAVAVLVLTGCQRSATSTHPLEATEPPSPSTSSPTSPAAGPTTDPGGQGDASNAFLTIRDPRVAESSGLARSNVHPGVLWTHNDRGGSPSLFAVDRTGTRAVLTLDAPALDWEDVASTPDGRLWVGDIGDNDALRTAVSVVVLDEPELLVSADAPSRSFELRYPDGPHDAEALLVDPRDFRVYVVTKAAEGGRVYRAPATLDPRSPNMLEPVGEAPTNITAGDFSPDGSRIVLRNQGRAFFYDELGGTPEQVTLPEQPQGESVAFTTDGAHVLVGSEGEASVLVRVAVPGAGD